MPLFAEKAIAVGHAQAALGPDSICRSVPVRELSLEGPRWAFALEVARVARRTPFESNGREFRIGEQKIPTVRTSSHAPALAAVVHSDSPPPLPLLYRSHLPPRP